MRGDLTASAKALAAVPDRRYASAQALADLRSHLAGRPVRDRDRLGYRVRKLCAGIASRCSPALIVATAGAGVAGIAWEAQKAREQALRATAEADNALEQAQRANAVREFMVGVLDQARPDATQGKPIIAHEMLDKAVMRLDNADVPNAVRADVLDVLGKLYFDVGDYERAESLLERAVATSQSRRPKCAHALYSTWLARPGVRESIRARARTCMRAWR
jgi:serine/threonine-protein kinase